MRTQNHKTKSQRQREYYAKTIKKLDYEPTLDEALKFPSSDDTGADLTIDRTERRRPPKIMDRLKEHFSDNWITWLIAAVACIFSFFIFSFNRDMGKVEGKVEIIDKSLSKIESNNNAINDKIHAQDLKIQDIQLRIEYTSKPQKK